MVEEVGERVQFRHPVGLLYMEVGEEDQLGVRAFLEELAVQVPASPVSFRVAVAGPVL
jgi:hypothetical protein